MMKINFLLILTVVILSCSSSQNDGNTQICPELKPQFALMLEKYDSIYPRNGSTDYDYVVCSNPYPNNKICISATLSKNGPERFFFHLNHQNSKVYFITGLENLIENECKPESEYEIDGWIYDPPVLCFEEDSPGVYIICEGEYRCLHCTSPPPPSSDKPTIKYESSE